MPTMHPDPTAHPLPRWTLSGLKLGARYTMPLLPGTALFGVGFGTVAVQKGIGLAEATLMSALVYGGAVQLVAMEVWTNPMTLSVIGPLVLITVVVNLRLFLMSASFRPWLGGLPPSQVYPALLLTTDASWLIAIRYRAQGGNDASVLLGSGLMLWVSWMAATLFGYLAGARISDPRLLGIDLILPIFFTAVFVPLWRGPRRAIPWGIAGLVALIVQYAVPGFWFMVAGALAGTVAGGFIDERD
jgi:predicted branched-subunit amino acid permease